MAIGAKSARIEVKVLGAREIGQVFDALPKQVNKNKIWIKFWREASKPLVKAARSRAVKKSGQLAKSIGFFTTKASRKYLGGYVGPRVKGAFAKRDKETGKYRIWRRGNVRRKRKRKRSTIYETRLGSSSSSCYDERIHCCGKSI